MAGKNNHSPWSLPFCLCFWHITNPLSVTLDCLLSKCWPCSVYHCDTNDQKYFPGLKWVLLAECFTLRVFESFLSTLHANGYRRRKWSNRIVIAVLRCVFAILVPGWHLLCDGSVFSIWTEIGGLCGWVMWWRVSALVYAFALTDAPRGELLMSRSTHLSESLQAACCLGY